MLARASGLSLTFLRARVASKMRAMGGRETFGPPANDHLERGFGRLELQDTFTRLMPATAFRALRNVVGELVAAEAIDLEPVRFILREAGDPAKCAWSGPYVVRPEGIHAPSRADFWGREETLAWVNAVEDVLAPHNVSGFQVLAAAARFRRRRFGDYWKTDQFFGLGLDNPEEQLDAQLHALPMVYLMDKPLAAEKEISSCGVAFVRGDMPDSAPNDALILCPNLARAVEWRSDQDNPFVWRDASGRIMAETIYWRDGGIQSRSSDTAVVGHGSVVRVTDAAFAEVQSQLPSTSTAVAWRSGEIEGPAVSARGSRAFSAAETRSASKGITSYSGTRPS